MDVNVASAGSADLYVSLLLPWTKFAV